MILNISIKNQLNKDKNMFNTQSDVVFVKGLKVEAVIGVYAWERAITQPILLDIAMETDISKAALSDDVEDALNYKAVCDDVSAWCKEIKAELLEHLAGQLADRILTNYACQKITLSVAKPTAIHQADAVGVQITRHAKAVESETTEHKADEA
jgi:dihydroneopterin aldolase